MLSGYVGGAYTQDLTATGGVGAYAWTLASGDFAGRVGDCRAPRLRGTLATAGSPFRFTLQVADAVGDVTTQAFSLTVGQRDRRPDARGSASAIRGGRWLHYHYLCREYIGISGPGQVDHPRG
jgi:hypothetical protein